MQKGTWACHSNYILRLFLFSTLLLTACGTKDRASQEAQYQIYCGSCHLSPKIEELPKAIWQENILPNMAARLGLKTNNYNPFQGLSYEEMEATIRSGIYPAKPLIDYENWAAVESYILKLAPDSLPKISYPVFEEITKFKPRALNLDAAPGALITYLGFDQEQKQLLTGDITGKLMAYDVNENKSIKEELFTRPIVDYTLKEDKGYVTEIGKLDPTQLRSGRLLKLDNGMQQVLIDSLHRPVHAVVEDLNGDGVPEFVISEFGDLRGSLSLFSQNSDGSLTKTNLLNQPGTIRVIPRDMNADGKTDLVAQTTQGDESITILYQQSDLVFKPEQVIRFSPVYGSSWFELVDYDGDEDLDIITVNGDNADKSFIPKPYHGLRIHINNGQNQFEEKYFFPLNGATRLISGDYDQDGDLDFFLVATFPDYDREPLPSLVFLENKDSKTFDFIPKIKLGMPEGRWFLLTSGDVDSDGDEDVIVSSFTYAFTPVPEELKNHWDQTGTDLLILENMHNQ
ncbi:MAG: VCBS repeat-containing protein [Eudoraea sp.]|nr:VCBS repeat-containing protein [Eudoraea sp.]